MCSMLEYEMLVSHSPPVFSHSPPTGFLSAGYPTFQRLASDPRSRSVPRGTCRQIQHTLSFTTKPSNMLPAPTSPKRPCLVIRPIDESCSSDEDPTSPTRHKKKVVFADDKGMSLTHVRVMTEPSNVPPLWSTRFLAEVTHGVTAEAEVKKEPWELTFLQPASDYVAFRKQLDTNKVSLENVIVKESEDQIMGTVKVSNMSFHKEVVVRSTANNWSTYEDAFCNYVPNNVNTSVNVLYDTFSFKVNLPPKSRKLEFCVCFRCDENEFWDNNQGKNYILVKKVVAPLHKSFSNDDLYKRRLQETSPKAVVEAKREAVQTKLDTWSEFASWTHLENSNPYCRTSVNSSLPN